MYGIHTDQCGQLCIQETDIQKKPKVYYSMENAPFNMDSDAVIDDKTTR